MTKDMYKFLYKKNSVIVRSKPVNESVKKYWIECIEKGIGFTMQLSEPPEGLFIVHPASYNDAQFFVDLCEVKND